MNTQERIELFNRELSYISDEKVKDLAKKILEKADDYFFHEPASSTGKYHPSFSLGEGGLVRHTKAVTYFLNELVRAELVAKSIDRHTADLLIVCAIAHDIKKYGDGSGVHTVSNHPELGAKFAGNLAYKEGFPKEDYEFIHKTIFCHMGPWSEPKPESMTDRMLFYADYVASRKEITGLSFIETNDNATQAPAEEPPVLTIEGYKFDFGKKRGQTLNEVYEKDPLYLKWIMEKEDFFNPPVQSLVKDFLAKKATQKKI